MSFVEVGIKKLRNFYDENFRDDIFSIDNCSFHRTKIIIKLIKGNVEELIYNSNGKDGYSNNIKLQGEIKMELNQNNVVFSNDFSTFHFDFAETDSLDVTVYQHKEWDALKIILMFDKNDVWNVIELVVSDKKINDLALHDIDENYH